MWTASGDQRDLVFGRSLSRSKRLLGASLAMFAVTFLLHTPPEVFPPTFAFGLDLRLLAALAVVPAAVAAFWNDGLLVSIALATGATLGFFVPLGLFEMVYPPSSVGTNVVVGLVVGTTFGAIAFVLGAGSRRLVAVVARHLRRPGDA